MLLSAVVDNEEQRRASFDVYHRPTRRQLPSVAHLEQQQQANCQCSAAAVPGRLISELPRSIAITQHFPPRKQTSSPLPEVKQRRIYEHGHILSKSWNPERYLYYETPPDVDSDTSVPTQAHDDAPDPYKKFYHEMIRIFGPNHRVNELVQENAIAAIDHRLSGASSFSKQAHSFDDRLLQRRSSVIAQRALNEAEQRQFVRQQTVFHLQPQSQISKECINLWADRKMLELNPHLANQISTDLSTDQSASTSFESNTEPTTTEIIQRRYSSFLELPHSADTRRQKYKNILLHRQHLSNTVHPQTSSFESVISSESSAADSMAINGAGTASFDSSTRSEQTDQDKPSDRKLSRQMSDSREDRNRLHSINHDYKNHSRSNASMSLTRHAFDQKMINGLQRDYSVDSKTDRLFKEFAKVDPKFESKSNRHNTSSAWSLSKQAVFTRHRTLDLADISRVNNVPLICFPE